MSTPAIKYGDTDALSEFSLDVLSLVGMLQALEGEDGVELKCGSHVDQLLSKLAPNYKNSFMEYCLNKGIHVLKPDCSNTYTLSHFSKWLHTKSQSQSFASRAISSYASVKPSNQRHQGHHCNTRKDAPTAVFMATSNTKNKFRNKPKPF